MDQLHPGPGLALRQGHEAAKPAVGGRHVEVLDKIGPGPGGGIGEEIGLADAGLGDVKQRLAVADGNAGESRVSGECGDVETLEPFEDTLTRPVPAPGKADTN